MIENMFTSRIQPIQIPIIGYLYPGRSFTLKLLLTAASISTSSAFKKEVIKSVI